MSLFNSLELKGRLMSLWYNRFQSTILLQGQIQFTCLFQKYYLGAKLLFEFFVLFFGSFHLLKFLKSRRFEYLCSHLIQDLELENYFDRPLFLKLHELFFLGEDYRWHLFLLLDMSFLYALLQKNWNFYFLL